MRKLILCSMTLLGMANLGNAQDHTPTSEKLTVQLYNDAGQLLINDIYKDEDAKSFDVAEFIKAHQDEGRTLIRGYFNSDLMIDQIKFDSNELAEDAEGSEICQTIETTLKPIIGVQVSQTDDLAGVHVDRVIDRSSAAELGMQSESLIMEFNGLELVSPCDLKLEVKECEVGQEVSIGIETDGRLTQKEITVGAKVHNLISYKYCPESNIGDLNIDLASSKFDVNLEAYPNPTSDISYLHFTSDSESPVNFYVLDIYGKTIHQETFNNFNGSLRAEYNFIGSASGTYLMAIKQNDEVYKTKVVYSEK